MLASTAAATNRLVPPCSSPNLVPRASPSTLSAVGTVIGTRPQFLSPMTSVSGREMVGSLFSGFPGSKFCWNNTGFFRRCKGSDSDGDFSLEAEILEFMKRSKKPGAFPSKKELVEGGREDLAAAIAERGGWLSLGWDLEEEGRGQRCNFGQRDSIMAKESDNGDQIRVSGSFSDDSSEAASSSGRPIEAPMTEDDSGIAGILNRLEKQRNLTLGFPFKDKEDGVFFPKNDKMYDWSPDTSSDVTVAGLVRSSRPSSINPSKVNINDSRDQTNHDRSLSDTNGSRDSPRPEMWRTWSTQRAGCSDLDFEAAEISYDKKGGSDDVARDEAFQITEGVNKPDQMVELDSHKEEINYKQIRSRIKHLESELSSALRSLRSKADEAVSEKGHDSSLDGLRKLSDAWEFQETEIMHAQDKLRSTRAKLAVLEGKMAMAIIDAQKVVDEKQKRINDARRAVRLLRTAFIVWPNSASEVLLVGSYDGWTTQRRMEKSSTGIFSLCLKLYPGIYEIKFIVDGEWRIDPLRPIVYSEGYQNNVLIIT